jgi:hypothetical protein
VTFGERGPTVTESEEKPLELAVAISYAFQLPDDDMNDVTIRDDKGNSISGEAFEHLGKATKRALNT